MEADGSFFLRNLGKSPVSVNGIAIVTGQLLTLSSSCLIEVIFLLHLLIFLVSGFHS